MAHNHTAHVLTGLEAIERAESGAPGHLYCYGNAVDDGGHVTVAHAYSIAQEDPSLIEWRPADSLQAIRAEAKALRVKLEALEARARKRATDAGDDDLEEAELQEALEEAVWALQSGGA